MRADLSARAVHLHDMRIDVHVRDQVLPVDYPAGRGGNLPPLELLLASLTACLGNTLYHVLLKMGAKPTSLEVEAKAERRDQHPTALTAIELVYHVRGETLDPGLVERAVGVAEGQCCPVMAMLRPATKIATSWKLNQGRGD